MDGALIFGNDGTNDSWRLSRLLNNVKKSLPRVRSEWPYPDSMMPVKKNLPASNLQSSSLRPII